MLVPLRIWLFFLLFSMIERIKRLPENLGMGSRRRLVGFPLTFSFCRQGKASEFQIDHSAKLILQPQCPFSCLLAILVAFRELYHISCSTIAKRGKQD